MKTWQKILLAIAILVIGTVSAVALIVALNQPDPEPAAVDTSAIVEQVLAGMPDPEPAADPLDTESFLADVEAAGYEGASRANAELLATLALSNTTSTSDTLPLEDDNAASDLTTGGEAEDLDEEVMVHDSPMLTPTFSLELNTIYSQPVTFAGGPPLPFVPNGDWFGNHTAHASWNDIGQTWKRAAEGCTLPGACNVFGPSGVLGADDYDEAMANDSAVWTGSMWHDSPDGDFYNMLCPEGSYCDTFASHFGDVRIGDPENPFIQFSIPPCILPGCSQGITFRNWLSRPGIDLNTNIRIEDYGAPSAASWTEYNVPPNAAEYKSEGYLTDRVQSAHIQNNNGSGPDDNHVHVQWVFDLNDMSLWCLMHTAEGGWELVWTNVSEYGEH